MTWNIKALVVQNKHSLHLTDLDLLLSMDGELPKYCLNDVQWKMDHVNLCSRDAQNIKEIASKPNYSFLQ